MHQLTAMWLARSLVPDIKWALHSRAFLISSSDHLSLWIVLSHFNLRSFSFSELPEGILWKLKEDPGILLLEQPGVQQVFGMTSAQVRLMKIMFWFPVNSKLLPASHCACVKNENNAKGLYLNISKIGLSPNLYHLLIYSKWPSCLVTLTSPHTNDWT